MEKVNAKMQEISEELEMEAMHTKDMEVLKGYLKHPSLWVREAAMMNSLVTDELIRERLEVEVEPNVQVAGVMNPNASHDTILYVVNNKAAHDMVKIACISIGKLTIHETGLVFQNDPRLKTILENQK